MPIKRGAVPKLLFTSAMSELLKPPTKRVHSVIEASPRLAVSEPSFRGRQLVVPGPLGLSALVTVATAAGKSFWGRGIARGLALPQFQFGCEKRFVNVYGSEALTCASIRAIRRHGRKPAAMTFSSVDQPFIDERQLG